MTGPITRTHRIGHAMQGTFRKFPDDLTEQVERAPWPDDALTRQRQEAARQRAAQSIADLDMQDKHRRAAAARVELINRGFADTERGGL